MYVLEICFAGLQAQLSICPLQSMAHMLFSIFCVSTLNLQCRCAILNQNGMGDVESDAKER